MSYGTAYIDIPQITKTAKRGGKGSKMSKTTKTEAPKASKKYAKTRGEHYKDIVIAILVTSIIAFIGGMQFANANQEAIDRAVSAVQPKVEAEATSK